MPCEAASLTAILSFASLFRSIELLAERRLVVSCEIEEREEGGLKCSEVVRAVFVERSTWLLTRSRRRWNTWSEGCGGGGGARHAEKVYVCVKYDKLTAKELEEEKPIRNKNDCRKITLSRYSGHCD